MLLEQLLAELQALLAERKRPGPLYVVKIREMPHMADKLGYTLALPPKSTAADVVKRTLSVKIGDAEAIETEVAAEVVQHEIIVDQDLSVHVELVDVDDAGNKSPASVLDFVAIDNIAPPQPGEMGVLSVREIPAE